MKSVLAVLALGFTTWTVQAARTVNAADYGLSESADAAMPLLAAIEACRQQRADRLILPRGIYHVYPTRAFQKYCAISNNDNGMKHIALPLIGFDGLTVDGQGAELMLHGPMMAVVIEGSTRVVVENLSVDWAQPSNFQGRVVAVDEAKQSFDLEPSAECNVSIEGGRLVNTERTQPPDGGRLDPWATPWQQDLRWSFFFDGATKSPAVASDRGLQFPPKLLLGAEHHVEKVGPNRYRLFNACKTYPSTGMVIVAKGLLAPNRANPAIHLSKAFNVTLRDVTVHHAAGMGLIGERSGDITLERFAVRLRPGSDRVVTTTADATHFVGCRGLIRFQDCYFENMLDDATNVHGTYTRIERQIGPRTVLAKLMHFQQFGFDFAEAGDRIRFSSRESLVPYAEAAATAVRAINDQYMEITFDRDLAGLLAPDSILDNVSWQPDVRMTGCTVSRNRARSILLSTAGEVLIERNTFDRSSMMNILLEGDAFVWHESCPTRHVRIVGNRFIDLNHDVEMIRISPLLPEGVLPVGPYHRNVVIEDNTFETLSPQILTVAHSAEIVFRNNRIVAGKGFQGGPAGAAAFVVENCRDITIASNDNRLPETLTVAADARSRGVKLLQNQNIK